MLWVISLGGTERFIDNQRIVGAIPDMMDEAVDFGEFFWGAYGIIICWRFNWYKGVRLCLN